MPKEMVRQIPPTHTHICSVPKAMVRHDTPNTHRGLMPKAMVRYDTPNTHRGLMPKAMVRQTPPTHTYT